MTADHTGVRQAVIPAHEMRRLGGYGRPSHLSEAELLRGYAVRLQMLRDATEAPCSPYSAPKGPCPCGGHR